MDAKPTDAQGSRALATVLVLFIAATAAYTVLATRAARGLVGPPAGDEATGRRLNYDWRIADAAGQVTDVADLKGKVLFVNLWSTECAPCVEELPAIDSLYRKLQGEGVVFLLVARDSPDHVQRFAARLGLTVPVYTLEGHFPQDVEPYAWPTTYVVSPSGDVLLYHEGAAQWDDADFVEFLRRAAERG